MQLDDADIEAINIEKDDLYLLQYRTVRDLVADGRVSLK